MTAPTVTVAAREAQREDYRRQYLEVANTLGRSAVCLHPDASTHDTCAGLDGMNSPLGCLCECHDTEVPS